MAIAKINPTGTHIQHGFLKVRVDIYPSSNNKTYLIHYVDKPNRPYTEEELEDEELLALVPKHKELNPCLCHFIKIDPETTLGKLIAEIREIFDPNTLYLLDNYLFEGNERALQQLMMHRKLGRGKTIPHPVDAKKLKEKVNKRFARLEIKV